MDSYLNDKLQHAFLLQFYLIDKHRVHIYNSEEKKKYF